MAEVQPESPPVRSLVRVTALAASGYLALYVAVSLATGQRVGLLGDLAQLVPPLAYLGLSLSVAGRSRGQARAFWQLNAAHAGLWTVGQVVWTYYAAIDGEVPVISPTDPIFFAAAIPMAAALYGRPDRDRPRWLFDIVVLDIVLFALFAAFLYIYFVLAITVTDGSDQAYTAHLTQLFNVRSGLLAGWAGYVWWTTTDARWRQVLGIVFAGLVVSLAGGVLSDVVIERGWYSTGSLWDLMWMVPFAVLLLAPARAVDAGLFEPAEPAPPYARLPMVSLIAVGLLVAIPVTDEIARRLFPAPPLTESLRAHLALTMLIPFGIVVFLREFLSRRALIRAGRDLVRARERLGQQEKMAAIGQLVQGVAHELNNPLQGVLGYTELMLAARPSQADNEELHAIRDSATRAAGIVRHLLTFAGEEAPARSWRQMGRLVHEAVARRRPYLDLAGIDVRLEIVDRLPLVYVDGVRMEQVIIQLVQNAEAGIEARHAGVAHGPRVPTGVRGEIVVRVWRELVPDRLLFEVLDNGSGLREADLTRAFDPFFTTRQTGEGTGLGLSVCYGVIREHGGQIRLANRPVGGTAVTVELPVATDAYAPRQAAAPVPSQRPRALVVDDEDSNAALVRRVLSSAGYEVESTTLSRRALVMLERSSYDVVIADVKMPELSGEELYDRVCTMRPEMASRFIFITGDIDGQATRTFLERTRCGYFMKPFNLEHLTSAADLLVGLDRGAGPNA
ncbi:MAG: ATP-binding protein [Vicinamibacterales bacterium]|nr:ATP-binding protein [Vicinamibacterales bacterium]